MSRFNTGNPLGSNDPRDLDDNAKNMDLAVNAEADTFQDRLGRSRLTWAGVIRSGTGDPAIAVDAAARAEAAASQVQQDAEQIAQDAAQQAVEQVVTAVDGQVQQAVDAADRAESAAVAAYASGNQFDDTSSGLAATVDGQYFLIRTADPQVFNVYLNDGGVAVLQPDQFSVVSGSQLSEIERGIKVSIQSPNRLTGRKVNSESPPTAVNSSVESVRISGDNATKIKANAGQSAAQCFWVADASEFESGKVSAQVTIASANEGTSGTVRIRQRNSVGGLIATAVIAEGLSGSITDRVFRHAGENLDPDCATVELDVFLADSVSPGNREFVVKYPMLADGDVSAFRHAAGVSTSDVESVESAVSLSASNPNAFSFEQAAALATEGQALGPTVQVFRDGVPYWSAVGDIRPWGLFARSSFDGDTVSAAVNIASIEDVTLPASASIRFLVTQYPGNALASEIVSARAELRVLAVDAETGFWRLPNVAIHEDCEYLAIYVGISGSGTVLYRDMLLCAGGDATFRVSAGGLAKVAKVGVGGDYATINDGLDAIGGAGTIVVGFSDSYGPEMRIDPAKCKGDVQVIGEMVRNEPPRILLADAVSGIELVSGETRVYRFPFSAAEITPAHVWIHDLPDAATAIPPAERMPQHDGRLYRLPSTQVKRLAAADLTAALAVMRVSDDPLCFYDSGWLYVTGPAGLDLTSQDIRVDSADGWVSGTVRNTGAKISVTNLAVRYGGANFRAFRAQELNNFSSIGSRGNAIDWIGRLALSKLEAAGAASWNSTLGDGLNGHSYGHMEGKWLYAHDNLDDGESTHENGSGYVSYALFENNGGAATASAQGAAIIYADSLSRRNQWAGLKEGAFFSAGAPQGGASGDTGFDTNALFIRCRSVADVKGFYDAHGDGGTSRAVCEDCVVEDQTGSGPAFDVYEVSNCRTVNIIGPAKAVRTIVRAQGSVVA